jgi:serine/threonine protein kinase/Tfp pilus assembly protein PilF
MFRAGDPVGPYTLIDKIGRGAFGLVWLAERRTAITTTKVAVKMPLDEEIDLDAIRQEANLWVQASGHPNVLPIIEANLYDDQVIIVSEYAPDGSLDDWLKHYNGGAPPLEVAAEMAAGILTGLKHLHSRQIIHRDLKPQNILLQGQIPRLADFGISRVLKSTSQSAIVAGTPLYMAPEAFEGKRNEQTDLWSVGVIFYQMVAGRLPFPQNDLTSLIGAIMTRNPDPLPVSVPGPLQEFIARALSKDTNRRYRSADEMRASLFKAMEAVRRGRPTIDEWGKDTEPPPPSPGPVPQPARPRAKVWVAALVACLVVAVLLAIRIVSHYLPSIERTSAQPSSLADPLAKGEKTDAAELRRWLAMLGQSGNVQEVIRQTSADLAANPLNPLARRARCAAYYLTHDLEAGQREAEEIERALLVPTTAEEYEARCYAKWRLKKSGEAMGDCTRAIELDPQYAWPRFTRAVLYAEKKDYDRSIADASRGIDLSQNYSLGYLNRGIAYYYKQEYTSALTDFNKAIAIDPQGAYHYESRGFVHYIRQDYDSALADFNKAIALDPNFAAAYADRGWIYFTKRDYNGALTDCDKAIGLDARNASAYSLRGAVYYAEQDYDRALAEHNQAIQLDPGNANFYVDRGNDYYAKQNYDVALSDFDKGMQLDPRNEQVYVNRGNLYYAQRDYDHALADYTKAIELNPRDGVAYANRALAYEATGESQRAAADRERAQELKAPGR